MKRKLWKFVKYLILVSAIVFFGYCEMFAQDLKLDRSGGRSVKEYWQSLQRGSSTGIGVGYQQVSFFNSLYFDNAKNGVIKNNGGIEILYFVQISPILIDLDFFYSSFDVNSDNYYPEVSKKSTNLMGLEGYVSFAPLLPDWGKISEIITPYLGIGYQTSSLRVTDENKKSGSSEENIAGSYGTSSPMWKGGIRINLGNFFIKGEYKQSLSISEPEAFNVISAMAGIKF